jgi:DNA-binding response OmpR family regulator
MQILLVEDDERVRRFVLRGLEAEGYTVTIAPDGVTGLSQATAEDFDVVILDVMLPGLDGREVCRQLRQAAVSTPVLMLTALDHTDDKVTALRGGADDYLTKPFDFDELLARIEALARRKNGFPAEPESVLEIGYLRIERDAMRVLLRGQAVELTAKEYQLLDLLMASPGKVLSRTRILNKVWGYDSDPLTNVVDVYIRRLRAKMHWDSETGWIRTIRNYGYRFDPHVPDPGLFGPAG